MRCHWQSDGRGHDRLLVSRVGSPGKLGINNLSIKVLRRSHTGRITSTVTHLYLAAHYGIRGAVGGFVAACASSSHALGCALDDIRLGRQKRMLVVGAEEATAESILPFAAMRALSPNPDPATA